MDRPRFWRRFRVVSPPPILLAVTFLLVAVLSGCSGPVAVRSLAVPRPVLPGPSQPSLESLRLDDLPADTRQTLRLFHLEDELSAAPEAAFRALDVLFAQSGNGRFAAAAAEIAYAAAQEHRQIPTDAASWYLLSASRAYDYLVTEPEVAVHRAFQPEHRAMIALYRRAVAGYLALAVGLDGGTVDHRRETPWDTFHVHWETGPGMWNPTRFDRLLPVDELEVRGLRNHYQRHGLGTPLVAVRENRRTMPLESFLPPEGVIRAATAVLVFEPHQGRYPGGDRRVSLRCYNPLETTGVEVGGLSVPLAADFTTPYAYLASQAEFTKSLLRSERSWAHLGLFLVEPYDPDKIPVVMIHGLRSTPLAWLNLTNDVRGDPVLRDAFQVWHYTYPTTVPYLYIGSLLRDSLEELRELLDPAGDDRAFRSMVVVGHSLGGLVARTLVTDPGTRLWSQMLQVAPNEELAGDRGDLERLRKILLFEPVPAVDRVVFIATPHGGSAFAASFVGRLGAALATLPDDFQDFFRRLSEANPDALRPEMDHSLRKGGSTSIHSLSPDHPMLQTLAGLPIADGARYHTIVSDRGTPEQPRNTDGFVPYASSSIPGAVSERVIYGAGHDVYAHPLAITEVKRILHEHLEDVEAVPALRPQAPSPGSPPESRSPEISPPDSLSPESPSPLEPPWDGNGRKPTSSPFESSPRGAAGVGGLRRSREERR